MMMMLGKFSADDILEYSSDFFQKVGFDISCNCLQNDLLRRSL